MAAPLYSDLAKANNDFFTTGYNFDQSVSVKSSSEGLSFESGGKIVKQETSGFLKGEYRDADLGKFTGEVWTTGVAKGTATFDKLAKNAKVFVKGNSAAATKSEPNAVFGVEYHQPQYTVSAGVDADKSRVLVNVSGCYKYENLAVGAEAQLAPNQKQDEILRNYAVGVRYSNPSLSLVLQSLNNGKFASDSQTTALSYLFHSKQNYSVAAKFQFQGETSDLEVGSLYETRDKAKLRLKANTQGVLTAAYQTSLANPNVEVSATVESNIQDFKAQKFGLKLVF